MGLASVSNVINSTCRAICQAMMEKNLKLPNTTAEWVQVGEGFYMECDFPNCIGAIDGKHFKIKKPQDSGSIYFNYKHSFSILMLALVDANMKFLYVDVGAPGHCSDAGLWGKCDLKKLIEEDTLQIPKDRVFPESDKSSPMVIVGDDAFPLKTYLMKPWPGSTVGDEEKTIFNARLVLMMIITL